jgi:predicted RNase H-like nuclease (RuvC/YqgF family)
MNLENQIERLKIANEIIHGEYMWAANRMLELKMDIRDLQNRLNLQVSSNVNLAEEKQKLIDKMQHSINLLTEDNKVLKQTIEKAREENDIGMTGDCISLI